MEVSTNWRREWVGLGWVGLVVDVDISTRSLAHLLNKVALPVGRVHEHDRPAIFTLGGFNFWKFPAVGVVVAPNVVAHVLHVVVING